MTADVVIHINIGPPVLWIFAVMIFAAVIYVVWLGATIREQMCNAARVGRMIYQQTNPPWQAPGPPLLVQRVDPKSSMILRHWGAEEDDAT